MNRAVVNTPRHFRNKALVGAIVAALALGTAGTAAADSLYSLDGTQSLTLQNYLQMISSKQDLAGPVNTSILNSEAGYRGPAADGALTVSGNTVQAQTLDTTTHLLGANGADNSVDLGLLGTQDANQGIGIFSGQLAGADVSTLLSDDDIGLDLTDYTAGNATVTSNTVNSTALVNNASNRATGALNTTPFSSTTAGHVGLNFMSDGTAAVTAAGGVTIGNAQVASGVTSFAQVTGTDVSLVNTGASSSAPVTVTGNTANAADTGNRGDNRFVAAAGGAVSYAGSVGVVNGQVNAFGSTSATVDDTDVGAELDGTAYSGELDVSNNALSASAQGNDAAAVDANNNLVRGNVISFANGIDVAGPDADASLALSFGAISGNTDTTGTADGSLALLNSQGNQGGTISGILEDSRIGADVATLSGGSLTTSANHATVSAGGNNAINLISADSAAFDASVAAGNQQANDSTTISAAATNVTLGVLSGQVSAYSKAAATVADSSIGAAANSNVAQTIVDVSGSNFTASSTDPVTANGGDIGSDVSLDAGTAGIAVGNLQTNFGTGIVTSASVENANLGVIFEYGSSPTSHVNDTVATVTGNALSATAGGNSAGTSIDASGTVGTLTASLVNGQYNANDIQAVVDQSAGGMLGIADNGFAMNWGGAAHPELNIALTVTSNAISASASANQSANSLSTDFDGSLALAGGGTESTTNASTNSANAALVLLNNQVADTGNVTSTVEGAQTGVDVSRSEFVSYTVNDNTTGSSAVGNSATNSLAVGAGNLTRAGSGTVAALGNLQQMNADSIALTQNASIGSIQEGVRGTALSNTNNYALSLTSAVSGNTLSAVAKGNTAVGGSAGTYGNTLTASGTNLVDTGTASSIAQHDNADGQAASAAFILQSNQSSTAGTRSATVANGFIGNRTSAYLSGNVMSVNDNTLTAQASDNVASNDLGLDFANLTTTAMLQNAQQSVAAMTSTVLNAEVGIDASTNRSNMGKDTVTVADNTVNASAVANTAANQLDLSAANNLGGNAADLGALGVPAGYRGAAFSAASGALVLADYGLLNAQDRSGDDVGASIDTAKVGVFSGGYFDERDLSPYTTSSNDGVATIADNTVSAFAQGNSANSNLVLDASGIDTTAAIFSRQSMASNAVASATDIDIGLQAVKSMSLVGPTANPTQGAVMPLTVSGNSVDSSARLNDASNVLSATASGAIAGSVGDSGASNDASRFDGYTGAVADFAVANEQYGSGNASASLNDVTAGILAGTGSGALAGDIGSTAGQSSLTVSDNSFAAQASGNTATNGVLLDGSSVSGSAAVNNQQALTGGTIGSDVNGVTVAAGNNAGSTGAITMTNVAISGNNVSGSASGNSATNVISVQGTALNGSGVDTEGAINGLTGTSTAIANHALNSMQQNNAAISTTMASINIGGNVSGGIGALTNSMATVSDNHVVGSAVGNSASNSITLASVAGIGMPSAALVSSQVNSAAISASVSNATIGVVAGLGSNSPVTVTGNTISASATGNSAINHIGIGN